MHPGPNYSVADVCTGWVEGLKAIGVDTLECNLDQWLWFFCNAKIERDDGLLNAFEYEQACWLAAKQVEVQCMEWWPDIIIVVSGFFMPPDIVKFLRTRGFHMVLHGTESPYEDGRQLEQATAYDTVLLNDPRNVDYFRSHQPRTHYMPHGYRPEIHHPAPGTAKASDVCFVGTAYQSRIDYLREVDWSGLDVALGGNWSMLEEGDPLAKYVAHNIAECLDNDQAVDLYRSTKVSFNLYRQEIRDGDIDGIDGDAVGPREVELAATRTFFLRQSRSESDALFPFLPTFDTPEELGDKCRWWTDPKRDGARARLAEMARLAVLDRSYPQLAARLLEIIKTPARPAD